MRITIDEVRTREAGPPEVRFSTAVGTASGIWAGSGYAMVLGAAYDIELTIDVPWTLGVTLFFSEERQGRITQDGARVILVGEVEAVDDDGTFYFRLAPDSLSLFGDANVALTAGAWVRLEVDAGSVQIFPFGTFAR